MASILETKSLESSTSLWFNRASCFRGGEKFSYKFTWKNMQKFQSFFWTHTEKKRPLTDLLPVSLLSNNWTEKPGQHTRLSYRGGRHYSTHFKASYRNNNWVICACVTLQICPISTRIIYLKPLFWNQSVKNHIYERFWANCGKNLHVHAPKQFTRAEIRKLTQHVVIIVRVPLMMLPCVQLCGFCV